MTESAVGKVADDALRGVKAIADELGITPRQAHHGLEQKRIPAGRDGNTWIASRRVLRERHEKLTAGQAA